MRLNLKNCGTALCVILLYAGCTSKSADKSKYDKEKKSAQTVKGTGTIDLNCVMDHIQNPTEAFHYTYSKQSNTPVDEYADITPQTIDGGFKNASVARTLHGDRSDKDGWQTAWTGLMGISGMSSTIALVKNSSATVADGTEKMNGYDTTRYSVDTARGDAVEQGLYRAVLGAGGFEKGTIWATDQGCPVKISLDSEMHLNNGGIDKVHYEEAMVRK